MAIYCTAIYVTTIALLIGGDRTCCAQQVDHPQAGPKSAARSITPRQSEQTGHGGTRWAFRALSPVHVSSPIVRLGDVVQPLDPNMQGWPQLRRSPIGLLPLGAQPMTIARDRLERAILDSEAKPLAIDWIGPKKIHVAYRKETAKSKDHDHAATPTTSAPVVQTSYKSADAVEQPKARIGESDIDRIEHWIELALDRWHPAISKEYRFEIPQDQPGLASLVAITGVTEISPQDRIEKGECRFRLTARCGDGPIESDIQLKLIPHPKVAVARNSLPRGHRLTSYDLELQPIPEEELEADHVLDPKDVIGMEVRGFARPGRPLSRSELGSPTLIRRGDLIEVRVMGGGVTVTTNAKAHGDGAASELIEVETLEPRKRMLARVVQPGVVEIVTRAPRVQP